MRRYPLNMRSAVYTDGSFYTLIPAARKAVAPGEKLTTIALDARFISATFPKANLTPLLMQAWAFYVPYRLLWPEWVDYLALPDEPPTLPEVSAQWAAGFEANIGGVGINAFGRRAYRLIYNQYFGSEEISAAWYPDINDPTAPNPGRLLAWEQWTAANRPRAAYSSATFQAPVAGGNASISLDDFSRAMRNNRDRRRQKITGDKYVDTMRLMGVDIDWRIQMAPEFLGTAQSVVHPSEVRSSSADDLTARAAEYRGSLKFVQKSPKAFSEHGLIMVLYGVRPSVLITQQRAYDARLNAVDEFFRPDRDSVADVTAAHIEQRYSTYFLGTNYVGQNLNGNAFTYSAVPETAYYPDPSVFVVADGSGPAHVSFMTDVSFRGLTPVQPNVA